MLYDKVANALAVIPVIIMVALINVLIASVMGMMTFLQLMFVGGLSKAPAEILAILVAIAVYLYIWYQPKIRSYISTRSQ